MPRQTPSTPNIVYQTGLDGYHFSRMHAQYPPEQIIQGFTDKIRAENPDVGYSDAVRRAASIFDYLEAQHAGEGMCRAVRASLNAASPNMDHAGNWEIQPT